MTWRLSTAALLLVAASGTAVAAPGAIRYTEANGRVAALTPQPRRVAVLYNSLLDLWYLAGGTAVGRVNGTTNVPPEAMDIEDLGSFASPNAERLFALRPDLVIFSGGSGVQAGLRAMVDQAGIESVAVAYTGYRDFMGIMDLFTSLTGRRDLYEETVSGVQKRVDDIVARVAGRHGPSVFILLATTRSLSAETPASDTGSIVDMLGGRNIVGASGYRGAERIDFSVEQVIARNPEVILVKTMGEVDACRDRVEELTSNEAWKTVSAVRSRRIHYLSKDLFMYKPNARFPEAFDCMARILHPEVSGETK